MCPAESCHFSLFTSSKGFSAHLKLSCIFHTFQLVSLRGSLFIFLIIYWYLAFFSPLAFLVWRIGVKLTSNALSSLQPWCFWGRSLQRPPLGAERCKRNPFPVSRVTISVCFSWQICVRLSSVLLSLSLYAALPVLFAGGLGIHF